MNRKIVTICGSMRFWNEIQEACERLELENGFVVIGVTPIVSGRKLTQHDRAMLGILHRKKIDLSDAIFVVNVGGYIGESVKAEIKYAKANGKEVLYLENAD